MDASTVGVVDGKKKRVKLLRRSRRNHRKNGGGDDGNNDGIDSCCDAVEDKDDASVEKGGHEVCIDIVSKAVHCYVCDDYVLSDAKWLAELREDLNGIELRRDVSEVSVTNHASAIGAPRSGSSSEEEGQKEEVDDDYELVEPPPWDEKERAKIPSKPLPPPPSPTPLYEPGIAGLVNLGNTCYMNSVLQMLSHCSGFRSFFRDFLRAAAPLRLAGEGGHRIVRQSTVRLKDALLEHDPPDRLALTEATHALLRVLWSGRWSSVVPRRFVNAVWKHGASFAARKQQDANEFLNFYLGRVDDELRPPKAASSVLMDLFGVDQYQEVRCDGCGSVTRRTEPLLGLVLSLPDRTENRGEDDARDAATETADDDAIDLLECFKSLRTTGRFVGDNQFDCDTCRAKKDATWSVTLQRYPQSLLVSLRRTLWNPEKGLRKDSRRVKFPLELDASSLLDMGKDRASSPDVDFEGCHYSLISVVSHSGSSPFVGHYISWCRVGGVIGKKWFLFNDSRVTPATEAEVLGAEAFILLYERRGIPSVE